MNTNNGVEAQNKHFKYDYLPRSVDKSVFGIAVLLVESFIPDSYQHYLDTNFKLSSRYSIPCYLRNRPAHFIKHYIRSKFQADECRESDVDCVDLVQGEFRVRSSSDVRIEYTVQLEIPKWTFHASISLLFSMHTRSGIFLACHTPTLTVFSSYFTTLGLRREGRIFGNNLRRKCTQWI